MEVSNQANQFQMMNQYQMQTTQKTENSIQPVPNPNDPKISNEDLYAASNGNAIKTEEGVSLTPQGELNVSNNQDANVAQSETDLQATRDDQRATATDYLGMQSKKSQVEIYLAVANEGEAQVDDSTPSIIESLRDVQKQNNAVNAYATYQENQQGGSVLY